MTEPVDKLRAYHEQAERELLYSMENLLRLPSVDTMLSYSLAMQQREDYGRALRLFEPDDGVDDPPPTD